MCLHHKLAGAPGGVRGVCGQGVSVCKRGVRPGHPYGPQVTGEAKGLMTASKAFTTNTGVATTWETLRTWPTSCSWTVDLHQIDGLPDPGLAVSTWCRRSARHWAGAHPRPSACCVTSQASKHALCGPPSPAPPPWWTSWHSRDTQGLASQDPRMKMNPSSGFSSQ